MTTETVDISTAEPIPPPPATYVLMHPRSLSDEAIARLHDVWRGTMGDAKVLVLMEGMTLDTVVPPRAVDILMRLVAASDGGSDTYEVRDLVEEARTLLGLPERFGLP